MTILLTILWFCVGDLAMLTFPISAIPLIFATRKLIASSIVETVRCLQSGTGHCLVSVQGGYIRGAVRLCAI